MYRGRFAPSPTGPLHAGSLVAALASWLDARAHQGQWLLRFEDVDHARCRPEFEREILAQLHRLGLRPDAPPVRQSEREAHYQAALHRLQDTGWAYPCACTRSEIEAALQATGHVHTAHAERVYPGTCRGGLRGRAARAWRLRVAGTAADPAADVCLAWTDRRLGPQQQNVTREVGDFVLRRADGCWAYQLAVVVDDAEQGISDVVRGVDLADNTPRQIHLQHGLGLPTPRYLHTPLVFDAEGHKLSKGHGASALALSDDADIRSHLDAAAGVLGLRVAATELGAWRAEAVAQWQALWGPGHAAGRGLA